MKKYLLDTDICIYYIKGRYNLNKKFEAVGEENCYISEITLAELKFGVENTSNPSKNKKVLDNFLSGVQILPIFNAIDLYAKEKARLKKLGTLIDDFDLLIGATAVANGLVMVTNNVSHFEKIAGIEVENWIKV